MLYLKKMEEICQTLDEKKVTKVLDIGCGANLIYCILGQKSFKWNMVGSDINEESISWAKSLVTKNNLENIEIRHQIDQNLILKGIVNEDDNFCMSVCNPPFFDGLDERKERKSACNETHNLEEST